MLPGPNSRGFEHEEDAILLCAYWSFHLTLKHNEWHASERVFRYKFRLTSGKIRQCSKRQGGSERFGPMNKASTQYLHRRKHKPLKARKNQNEFLLEDNALIFLLQNEHLPTCSNFTWSHVDLQPVGVCSIALAVAFSEQMYQVASTGRCPKTSM